MKKPNTKAEGGVNSNLDSNEEKNEMVNFLPSNHINGYFNQLSNPSFLGSIHLKKEMNPNNKFVDNLIKEELKAKMDDSIKSSYFNPVTKILIAAAICFNIFWFLFIYLF